jgi:hypothetical protein
MSWICDACFNLFPEGCEEYTIAALGPITCAVCGKLEDDRQQCHAVNDQNLAEARRLYAAANQPPAA